MVVFGKDLAPAVFLDTADIGVGLVAELGLCLGIAGFAFARRIFVADCNFEQLVVGLRIVGLFEVDLRIVVQS